MSRYTAEGVVHPVPPFSFGRPLAFLGAFAGVAEAWLRAAPSDAVAAWLRGIDRAAG